jgi:NAD(P)-dependent dehydrogenase (short-subunit alcohol dehydrogenase family)
MSLPKEPRVVVTGAGGGLGQAFCRLLGQRGAKILASDLTLDGAKAGAAQAGASAHALAADVTRPEQLEALAAKADELLGGVDLFINNAGVAVSGRVGEVALSDWKWLLDVNLMGVVNGLHAFVPRMRKQRSGHILNVASAAGLLSSPLMAPYNASKAAVVAISETLYAELYGEDVGVSVLCPLFFKTGIAEHGRGTEGSAWLRDLIAKLMERDTLGADGVATYALRSCERGELYSLPHPQSRVFWRMKRLVPSRVAKEQKRALLGVAKRFGIKAII